MNVTYVYPRLRLGPCLCALVILAWPTFAPAAQVTFRGTYQGEPVTGSADAVDVNGVPHISLWRLTEQLGGEFVFTLRDGRVQLTFGEMSAWSAAGERTVYGSLDRVTLDHPLTRSGNETLIAVSDVTRLFRSCFRIELSLAGRGAEAPPDAPDAHARIDDVDPFAPELLDGVPLPANLTEPAPPTRTEPAQPPSTRFKRILIDPGHGGADTGAVGPTGFDEKTLTLAVAQKLKALLAERLDAEVLLTRDDDRELSAAQRGNIAVRQEADLFVSLHAGASMSPAAYGFEIFCPPAVTSGLGGRSRSDVSATLAHHFESALVDSTGMASRGVRQVALRTMAGLSIPGLLIELGCITNATEEAMLASDEYQQRVAEGIVQGLETFSRSHSGSGR